MTTSNNAVANQSNGKTSGQDAAPAGGNDYINHYLAGNPIIYIYRVTSYTDPETDQVVWFYKGNMKTGAKTGDQYIPVEGSLSKYAYEVLEPIIDLLDTDDASMRRSVGATCKTPRFEGVNAFVPKTGQADNDGVIKPVAVARFRLNTILNTRLFKKEASTTEGSDQSNAKKKEGKSETGKATKTDSSEKKVAEVNEGDIPF